MSRVDWREPGALLAIVGLSSSALLAYGMFQLPENWQYIGLAAAAAGVILLVWRHPAVHVGMVVALFFLASTDLSRTVPFIGIVARSIAVLICLLVAWRFTKARKQDQLLWTVLVCGSAAYAFTGVTAGFTRTWLIDAVALLMACLCLLILSSRVTPAILGMAMRWMLLATLLLSLGLGLGLRVDSGAVIGSRLEGVFANANTLGFMAGLALALALFVETRNSRWLLGGIAGLALVMTASRSALFAIVVATALTLVHALFHAQPGRRRIVGTLTAIAVVGYLSLPSLTQPGVLILRTNNSRELGFDYALWMADMAPWRGVGYGNSAMEVASTPLRWLAEAGWPGFACVVAAYVMVHVIAWRGAWPTFLLISFGAAHSIFEGWYFAGGSSLFFAYWLVVLSSRSTSPDPVRDPEALTPESPGSRRSSRSRSAVPRPLPAP